tara:strand:+ start:134 stop:283 length:150 start_codon:yes stop_codon:yes gene_type:complete
MRIEHLINKTYQITDGSTVWFQGSLSDCKLYLNQNKEDEQSKGNTRITS